MIIFEYKNFIKKLASELRGKSQEEINRKIQEFTRDLKKEIRDGTTIRK